MKADKKSAVLHGMWFSQVFAQGTEDKQLGIINTLFFMSLKEKLINWQVKSVKFSQ